MGETFSETQDQDVLIMEYMDALLNRSLDTEAMELPTSGVKSGFELVVTIDLAAIMSGQKRATRYEAMIVLMTNIHLMSKGSLGRRVAQTVLTVSRKMIAELTAR